MSQSLFGIHLARIDGEKTSLAKFKGNVLLVVNVASKCSLTPQYEGLQKLYDAKHPKSLEILGFPANNFGAQEPGTEAEIAAFCVANGNPTPASKYPHITCRKDRISDKFYPCFAGIYASHLT